MATHEGLGHYAPDFELPAVDGAVFHLRHALSSHRAIVVVFMCNHCPYVGLYLERLKTIQADYAPAITIIGINANDDQRYPQDSFEAMKEFAQSKGIPFPYLRDRTQDVARAFGATVTPEVFVLDHHGIIRYIGRIDDHQEESHVQQRDLRQALDQILKGEPISVTVTQAIGCSIKWRA